MKSRLGYFDAEYPLPSVRELIGAEWSVFVKEFECEFAQGCDGTTLGPGPRQ